MHSKCIIIGADIVPTESNISYFVNGNISKVVGEELLSIIRNDSFLICNLETPLCDTPNPIIKCGPAFITPSDAINGIKELGVNLISLANNHIKDQGQNGIISTCKTIESSGLPFIGVGENERVASKPYYFEFEGKTIGVYSCVEHEFSVVTNNEYGANLFDPLNSLDHIEFMKNKCDYVIVLYHGGKEYYRLPSPYLQKVCRRIVDKGADLVVCQHSHCIGAEEKYNNGIIVYGQGNFIFNKKSNEFWDSSLLIEIDVHFNIRYIPIVRTDIGTRLANEKEKNTIMNEFQIRSSKVYMSEYIINEYKKFSKSMIPNYISEFNGQKSNIWFLINKISNNLLSKSILKKRYPKKQMAKLKNYIECESHRELIINAINEELLNN